MGDCGGEQAAITPRMTTSTVKLGKSPWDRKSWGWIINRLTGSVWLWAWPSVIALMSSRKICLPQIWSVKAVVRPTVYPLCCTTVAVQAVYRRVIFQIPPWDHPPLLYPIPWLLCKVRCIAVHVISVQAGGTLARVTSLQLKPVANGAPVAPFGERDTLPPRPLLVSLSTDRASRSIISARLRGRRQYGLSSNTEPGDFL